MGDQEPEKPVDSHFFSSRNKSEDEVNQPKRKYSTGSPDQIKLVQNDRKLSALEATGFEQIMQ